MKTKILVILFLVTFSISYAQDYMEVIATKACECVNSISDTVNAEEYTMQLGLCMISAANPYRKEIKKDYKIDLNDMETQAEALGQIIGLKMLSICPDALIKVSNFVKQTNKQEVTENMIEGQIISIDDTKFVEFTLRDFLDKRQKFYWLTFAESNINIMYDYLTLKDKSVKITYITQEFFDPRIGEYKNFNIIQKIELIKE